MRLKKIKENQPNIRMILIPHNASADANTRAKMNILFLHDIINIIKSSSIEDLANIQIIPEHKKQLTDKISEINTTAVRFTPILTNGKRWVIFKKNFIREPFNKIIVQDHAEVYSDLKAKNFFQTIIKKLKNT